MPLHANTNSLKFVHAGVATTSRDISQHNNPYIGMMITRMLAPLWMRPDRQRVKQ